MVITKSNAGGDIREEEGSAKAIAITDYLPAPTPANLPLRNADDVRLEMAKVYREMRGGQLDLNAGAKLVWVLSQLNRVIETSVIEQRMVALERATGIREAQ